MICNLAYPKNGQHVSMLNIRAANIPDVSYLMVDRIIHVIDVTNPITKYTAKNIKHTLIIPFLYSVYIIQRFRGNVNI